MQSEQQRDKRFRENGLPRTRGKRAGNPNRPSQQTQSTQRIEHQSSSAASHRGPSIDFDPRDSDRAIRTAPWRQTESRRAPPEPTVWEEEEEEEEEVEIEESDQEEVEIEESDQGVKAEDQAGSSASRTPHPRYQKAFVESLKRQRVSEGQRPNYIRQIRKEQDPQKFAFLLPEDEHHWYFLECLNIGSAKELTAGTEVSPSTSKPVPEPASAPSTPAPKRSTGGFVPEPPAEIRGFIENIAQSAAEHGDDWQWEVYRKQDRTAYNFLHPGHKYHRFFLQQKERALSNTDQTTYLPTGRHRGGAAPSLASIGIRLWSETTRSPLRSQTPSKLCSRSQTYTYSPMWVQTLD